MVLACINVTTVQAASLQIHTARPAKTKSPHVSSVHLAFLFDKWKESLDKRSDFKKLLDTIEPHQAFQVGPNYAQDWEEHLAHEALHCSCQGEFAEELVFNCASEVFMKIESTWTMVDELNDIFTLSSTRTHVYWTDHSLAPVSYAPFATILL